MLYSFWGFESAGRGKPFFATKQYTESSAEILKMHDLIESNRIDSKTSAESKEILKSEQIQKSKPKRIYIVCNTESR
ncbi:hypothetical protein [uncultured Helicobacter sp.]|uniref:hypothetical protein n=1 Tax=uncultured Helicobacter sp. TaxID=175537 RepID=UPI0037539D12